MMNDTDKPFSCCEKDCEMTFTNEDHLNWHRKKHDMILNLGLAKNDAVADQTPTPTRFIRNCEEVGLFQDLQNVNPFDEDFKKAVEVTQNGGTLEVPETNSEDTLHTPHIFPHIEENRKNNNNIRNNSDDTSSQTNEFTIIPIGNVATNETNGKECAKTPVIVIDDESDVEKSIKKKIKEVLQSKKKQRLEKEINRHKTKSSVISVVPFQNLTDMAKLKKVPEINNSAPVDDARRKLRESNKAAQTRCRKRKQIRWKEMEEEIMILRGENKKLKLENYNLYLQLTEMKKALENVKVTPAAASIPVVPQVLPEGSDGTSNFVIQIIPSTSSTGAASVVPAAENSLSTLKVETVQNTSHTSSISSELPQKNGRKNLRKIVPKIIIEN